MRNTKFIRADLSNVWLRKSDLTGANMNGANLSGADLTLADFTKADMTDANLSNANFEEAKLKDSILKGAILDKTLFHKVTFFPIDYEPMAGSVPYIPSLINIKYLEKFTFSEYSHGLVDLRNGFKDYGYREQERKITYALRHTLNQKELVSADYIVRWYDGNGHSEKHGI